MNRNKKQKGKTVPFLCSSWAQRETRIYKQTERRSFSEKENFMMLAEAGEDFLIFPPFREESCRHQVLERVVSPSTATTDTDAHMQRTKIPLFGRSWGDGTFFRISFRLCVVCGLMRWKNTTST